jgi:hypothetical protein
MLLTSLDGTNAMELKLDKLDSPRIVANVLALVGACLEQFHPYKK